MRFKEGDPAIRDSIHLEDTGEVRFIDSFVDCLDMAALGFRYSERFSDEYDETAAGRPPWDPRDLLKAHIRGYLNGRRSSRKLAKECAVNDEMKWLLKGLTPSFKALSDFRRDNIECIRKVFKEFVYFCDSLGLFGGKVISVDGSKFKAVNSKDRNFTRKKLEDRLKRIEQSVNRYLEELRANDEKLDKYIDDSPTGTQQAIGINDSSNNNNENKEKAASSYQPQQNDSERISSSAAATNDKTSSWWKKRVREKLENLLKRKEKYLGYKKKMEETGTNEISLTDEDSRLMKVGNQSFGVCYNVEASVDLKFHLIPEYDVTNSASDMNELFPMAKGTMETLHLNKIAATADTGFFDSLQIKECLDHGILTYLRQPQGKTKPKKTIGIPQPAFYVDKFTYDKATDSYLCPANEKLPFWRWTTHNEKNFQLYRSAACFKCQFYRTRCTLNKEGRIVIRWEHVQILEEMADRIKTEKGLEIIEKRQQLSEHPFGTVKRDFGEDYFLLKGIKKVIGEAGFFFLAYNLRRVLNIFGGGVETLVTALTKWHPSSSDSLLR